MSGLPWGKFWWRDWLNDPALSACSLAAQGLWMRMLCVMAHSTPVGHLILPRQRRHSESEAVSIARMFGGDTRQVRHLVSELEQVGVFDRINGVIISRRMVRDQQKSEAGRAYIAKRGGPWAAKSPNRLPNRQNGTDLLAESESESESPSPTPTPASGGGVKADLIKAVKQGARSPAVPKGAARGKPFRIITGGAAA
jgi:hypothetical protein